MVSIFIHLFTFLRITSGCEYGCNRICCVWTFFVFDFIILKTLIYNYILQKRPTHLRVGRFLGVLLVE